MDEPDAVEENIEERIRVERRTLEYVLQGSYNPLLISTFRYLQSQRLGSFVMKCMSLSKSPSIIALCR